MSAARGAKGYRYYNWSLVALLLLWALHACLPRVRQVWADGGYAGYFVDLAATAYRISVPGAVVPLASR
jgi:uncharacterized membrane protein